MKVLLFSSEDIDKSRNSEENNDSKRLLAPENENLEPVFHKRFAIKDLKFLYLRCISRDL